MDLSVRIPMGNGEFRMKNPVMPAAATFGNLVEYKEIVDLERLGAMLPNSLSVRQGSPSKARKFHADDRGIISSFSLNNITVREFVQELLPELPFEATPVVVDLKGYDKEEMWQAAEEAAAAYGVAAIEVNLNCPYGHPGAKPYWKDLKELEELVRGVKQVSAGKPVFAKTATSEVPLGEVIHACADGGADAFVSFNGLSGGCGIDIRNRCFQCGGGGMGGYSGPGVKPYALGRTVNAVKCRRLPVIGAGGITCASDILEFIMAGAYAVQVGSANLKRPDAMFRMLEDLECLMEELGIENFDEIRGVVLR